MSRNGDGVYIAIFKKAINLTKNGKSTRKNSDIDWQKLKEDLEGLSRQQFKMILELVEHMKKVNEEDIEEVIA